jgi:hypothetical protein
VIITVLALAAFLSLKIPPKHKTDMPHALREGDPMEEAPIPDETGDDFDATGDDPDERAS